MIGTLDDVTSRFADGHASVDVHFARPLPPEDLSGKVATLPGVVGATALDARRVRLRFDGGIDAQERLLEALVALHLGVVSLAESESALEEMYLSQVSRGD